jgi:putative flippase GtrA
VNGALGDLLRYALASVFSFVLVIASTAALHELLGVSQTLAPALALGFAFVVNFTLLRTFVFPNQSAHWGRQMFETAITSVLFRVLEYSIFLGLHLGLEVDYLLATAASLCISAVGKFAVYREIVFNRRRAASGPAGSR